MSASKSPQRSSTSTVDPRVFTDPATCARACFGVDLWKIQRDIAASVVKNRRTCVKACHSSGKTFLAAFLTLWWILRYRDAKVITTAPKYDQVRYQLWGDLHTLHRKCRVNLPQPNLTEMHVSSERWALGLSTKVQGGDEGVRFQGFHGEHLLIIVDEAPGLPAVLWDAIHGISASGNVHILELGNPTIPSGPFYEHFTQGTSWEKFTISAFDTPNLLGLTLDDIKGMSDDELDVPGIPYLTSKRYVSESLDDWGEDNPKFEARVLGQFPTQSEHTLIPLAWVEAAAERESPSASQHPVIAGVDVAGPGDDETVLIVRQGGAVLHLARWPESDPRGALIAELRKFKHLNTVNVDIIGIGYYLAKHLADQGFRVNGVNVANAADDTEQFANLRAELHWGMRDRFKDDDVSGVTDERLQAQLAGLQYKHNPRGQIQIESKEDARKRGVKSPDRADALMLAFAPIDQGEDEFVEFEDLVEISPY